MWVGDDADEKIYAYTLASRQRDPGRDIETLASAGNTSPGGIWSDGTTMWVGDDADEKIYAYTLATGQPAIPAGISRAWRGPAIGAPGASGPTASTMWVVDDEDDKIYAYELATGQRGSVRDFDDLAGGVTSPTGLSSDGTTMWVADAIEPRSSTPTTCLATPT